MTLNVVRYSGAGCTGTTSGDGNLLNLIDYTCSPYHMHWQVNAAHNGTTCFFLHGLSSCGATTIDVYLDE